jgi:hypothetical protein
MVESHFSGRKTYSHTQADSIVSPAQKAGRPGHLDPNPREFGHRWRILGIPGLTVP